MPAALRCVNAPKCKHTKHPGTKPCLGCEAKRLHDEGKGPAAIAVVLGIDRKRVVGFLRAEGARGAGGTVARDKGDRDRAYQTRGFWRP